MKTMPNPDISNTNVYFGIQNVKNVHSFAELFMMTYGMDYISECHFWRMSKEEEKRVKQYLKSGRDLNMHTKITERNTSPTAFNSYF